MRILNRTAFMNLPAGVLYTKGKPWYFEGLMRKDETIHADQGSPIDWFYQDLVDIDGGSDSGERYARLEEMSEQGTSYPYGDAIGRDGCFDEEELFLVFERDDLVKLREIVDAAIKLPPTIDEHPVAARRQIGL